MPSHPLCLDFKAPPLLWRQDRIQWNHLQERKLIQAESERGAGEQMPIWCRGMCAVTTGHPPLLSSLFPILAWDARCCCWALLRCCGPINETQMKEGAHLMTPMKRMPPQVKVQDTSYPASLFHTGMWVFLVLLLLSWWGCQELPDKTYQVGHIKHIR